MAASDYLNMLSRAAEELDRHDELPLMGKLADCRNAKWEMMTRRLVKHFIEEAAELTCDSTSTSYSKIIVSAKDNQDFLNCWEKQFIDSLFHVSQNYRLSAKQSRTLEVINLKIWNRLNRECT